MSGDVGRVAPTVALLAPLDRCIRVGKSRSVENLLTVGLWVDLVLIVVLLAEFGESIPSR